MKLLVVVRYLFTAIGVALLVAAFYAYHDTKNFLEGALTADGVVTELVRSRSSDSNSYLYRPVVEFYADDGALIEITSSIGSSPPSYAVGEEVTVVYHADRPHKARIDSFLSLYGLQLILAVMGSIFFLVGFTMIFFSRRRSAQVEYLKQNGSPVQAQVQSVERNTSLRVNGRSPYKIYAQWQNPYNGELHVFESENIWFNPEEYLQDQVTVLINERDPGKHYMDISFLPALAD